MPAVRPGEERSGSTRDATRGAVADRHLRATLETIDLLGVVLDRTGRIALCNDFLLGRTGRSRDDVLEGDWFELFLPPESRDELRCTFLATIDAGTFPAHLQHEIVTSDGSRLAIAWSNTTLRDADGRVEGVASIGEDITERERATEALRQSLASTTAALDATVETVAMYRAIRDEGGRFVDAEIMFANEIGRRRWLGGASLDEVRLRRLFEVVPALRPLIFDLYAEAVDTGTPYRGIRELPTADGPRVFELAITPFEGGFVHVGRDVTDEQRAMTALRESEERLRRTVEGVDAIVSYQECVGAPVIISLQAERILGVRPDQLTEPEDWIALVHPDDLAACLDAWNGPTASWKIEYRMRRADGTWIWVGDRGRRIVHDDGRGPGVFGVVVDITAQHEAAARVRESEAMFRAAFEENPETIWVFRPVTDVEGSPVDAVVLFANRIARARYMGGVSLDDVVGSRLFERWPELRVLVSGIIAAVVARGEPVHEELHGTRADGEFWSETSALSLRRRGRPHRPRCHRGSQGARRPPCDGSAPSRPDGRAGGGPRHRRAGRLPAGPADEHHDLVAAALPDVRDRSGGARARPGRR